MKKRVEKKKIMVSITKNPYCVVLENAGERTQGSQGHGSEGNSITKQWYFEPKVWWSKSVRSTQAEL